jgi:hypothetical protein
VDAQTSSRSGGDGPRRFRALGSKWARYGTTRDQGTRADPDPLQTWVRDVSGRGDETRGQLVSRSLRSPKLREADRQRTLAAVTLYHLTADQASTVAAYPNFIQEAASSAPQEAVGPL